MSKGPGKWQKLILGKLYQQEVFTFRDLLGDSFTKARYNALHRAFITLARAGQVWGTSYGYGNKTIYVHRVGTIFSYEDKKQYDASHKRWYGSPLGTLPTLKGMKEIKMTFPASPAPPARPSG